MTFIEWSAATIGAFTVTTYLIRVVIPSFLFRCAGLLRGHGGRAERRREQKRIAEVRRRIETGDLGPMPEFNAVSGDAVCIPVANCKDCIARFGGDRKGAIRDAIVHHEETGHTVIFNPSADTPGPIYQCKDFSPDIVDDFKT